MNSTNKNYGNRYGNVLTMILVVVVVIILGIAGYFGYSIYKQGATNKAAEAALRTAVPIVSSLAATVAATLPV